jgi:predicted GNAT family acetyltransferase
VSVVVRDNPRRSRYVVFADGDPAGFALYRLRGDRMTLTHTEIDPAFEGRGLGGELARYVLDDVRARGLELEPLCPFMAGYIRRHPDEYLDLVVPSMREKVMEGIGQD